MFAKRIKFESAQDYADCARMGLLRPGQYVEFEGVKARFAWSEGSHVTTFYWSTGATKAARSYLRSRSKRHPARGSLT